MTWRNAPFVTVCAVAFSAPAIAQNAVRETVFYMTGGDAAFDSFRDHVDQIDVIGPQVYAVEGDGVVWGAVDPRVLSLAKQASVKVMPLIHNPGFNQESIHTLLADSAARARTIASMVQLGREFGYWGWQFDFENVHVSDTDRFTAFYREAAEALHAAGMTLSVAVVPTDGRPGHLPFHRYMLANWRGNFDVAALAEAGDFISLMTYAQHGGVTTPGPIAGLPWMRRMVQYALDQGVPAAKISLGIPSYSGYWRPDYTASQGAKAAGAEVSWSRARALLDQNQVEATWLPDQGSHLAYWERSGTFEWLFLEDHRSFATKLALLDEFPGLRGISVWVLGAEDPDIWPLLGERRRR
ncbi:MAG TPA: glycosyl hydrolase family 18 protein [Gemmatimonadales bacterium]|jgi:spore germination protein YaaH